MLGFPRASSPSSFTLESLVRILAALNGRARRFRFTSVHLFDLEAGSTVFDRNDVLAAPSTESPTAVLDGFVRRSRQPWSTEDAASDARVVAAGTNPAAAPASAPAYRAYVGVPLIDAQGAVFGVLCHFDDRPATLDAGELEVLVEATHDLSSWLALWALHQRTAAADARAAGISPADAERARIERESREHGLLLSLDAGVSRALVAQVPLRDNLRMALDVLVQKLGVACAHVWTLSETADTLELQASAGLSTQTCGVHARVAVGAFKVGRVAATRRPLLEDDVTSDDGDPEQEWARREGLVSFAGYPLILDERLVGVFAVLGRRPLSSATLLAMETVGSSLAQSIDRRQAEERLRARELWLSTTLASIGDAVIATDEHGIVNYLNGVATELTGWSVEEAKGHPLLDVFPIFNESTGAVVESPVDKVLREGRIVGLANHTVLRHRSGRLTAIEDSAAPIHLPGGPLIGVVLVFRDATAVRRAEAERERLFHEEQAARRDADVQRGQLQTLIQNAPVAIATWKGPRHTFDTINDRYLELLQGRRDVIGKDILRAFPETDAAHPLFQLFDEVYRTGVPHTEPEYRVQVTQDGQPLERIFTFTLVPIRDASGQVDGLMACVADISEVVRGREQIAAERDRASALATAESAARSQAEQERDRSNFLLHIASALGEGLELEPLLQRLADAIVPLRADFTSVWGVGPNHTIRRIVHAPYTAEVPTLGSANAMRQSASFPIQRVVDTGEPLIIEDLPRWMEKSDAAADAKVVDQLALRHLLAVPILRGREVVAVLSVSRRAGRPFTQADRDLFVAVAHQTALSFENARLYAETVRLRKAAEHATLAKDQFLARVSHDLRNPLTSILGWASLLRDNRQDPTHITKGIDVIERNARAQVQLIEDLLDVSRISSGKMRLELATQAVQEAIEQALDTARLVADAKGVHIRVSIDREVGIIAVDPDRFRQVVWNLVSNAVKFTPAGGTVSVSAQRAVSQLHVVVADTGCGISANFLPHVFESFEQAAQGARRTSGLGLGLAIVRHIVELHGGTVHVESDGEGRGSRFTVSIPIRAAIRPAGIDTEGEPMRAPRVLAGVHVLATDDEEDAREVVAAILRQAGATVTLAGSADEALATLRQIRPAILVSDIGMPEKDGKWLLRQVRALPEEEGGRIPAVALTALARSKDRIEVLSAGFNTHVAKPAEPKELVLVVAGLLGREIPEDAD